MPPTITAPFLEQATEAAKQPDPDHIDAVLQLKHKHGFFIIPFKIMPDGTKRPTNRWRKGAKPVTDEQIRQHRGLFGYRHDAGTPHLIDVDFHGALEPRYPLEITEALKAEDTGFFLETTYSDGYHIYTTPGDFDNPAKSGSPSYFFRGLNGELRYRDCISIVYDPQGFLTWLEDATEPPTPEFYAALLSVRVPKPSRYNNPLMPELWPALVLRQPLGRLIGKWRREGYAEDFIKITLRKNKRRYRGFLKAAQDWIDAEWDKNDWQPMRGFGRDHLAMILLLGEQEALSYASRIAIASGLKCCVTTISRWRRQWLARKTIAPAGYNVIRAYPSGWEDRIPRFALPHIQQTVTVKHLLLSTSGQRSTISETFTLDVGARAPPSTSRALPIFASRETSDDQSAVRQVAMFNRVAVP